MKLVCDIHFRESRKSEKKKTREEDRQKMSSASGAMYTSRILILFECRALLLATAAEECTHKKPFSANLLLDYRSSSLIDKTI